MYTVYLVDDEQLALDDMCNNLPWSDFNFTVIGKQTSPLKALTEIMAHPADIVMTDIRMPEMNGLEMIEKLRKADCNSIFVVVSAFDDFNFVRKTMLLSGFDYIIKPITRSVASDLFNRLQMRLNETIGPPLSHPLTGSHELNEIAEFIIRNITRKLTLTEIGSQFNVSANHICNLFSKHLNTTFLNYILTERMTIARDLLLNTDKAVKEVAILSGYDDYFYFCKVFRSYYHCTPTAMRQQKGLIE